MTHHNDRRPTDPGHRAARRRWPLLAIGASAGTATWSGWVGLGQLTGFGVVHPLPGIADSFTINTAVTLPIGVEAYAMYALSIATSSRPLPDRTRRYAWASSAAALLLGMAGQVAYHVMTAHQPTPPAAEAQLAPWWVIALVSCLPVLVLGAASLLWHLAADVTESAQPTADVEPKDQAETIEPVHPLPDPPWWPIPDHSAPRSDPAPPEEPIEAPDPIVRLHSVPADRRPGRIGSTLPIEPSRALPTQAPDSPAPESRGTRPAASPRLPAREQDVVRVRDAIEAGQLPPRPTASAIRELLAISPAYARAARDAITTQPARSEHPPQNDDTRQISTQQAAQESPEELPEKAIQQQSSTTETLQQQRPRAIPEEKEPEDQTYATPLS